MKKMIAHRGLLDGPDKEKENHISTIEECLKLGYDCEIDVRYITDKWFLGHDEPQYELSIDFIYTYRYNLWVHAKNEDAFIKLNELQFANFFWHDTDTYTITSRGIPWIYPGKKIFSSAICVLPELNYDINNVYKLDCLGVCSDYINAIVKFGDLI